MPETIGTQLLDGDCSHGWQIVTTQAWAPTKKGRQADKRKETVNSLEDVLYAKQHSLYMLEQASVGEHMHIKTSPTAKGMLLLFVVMSVKLHNFNYM